MRASLAVVWFAAFPLALFTFSISTARAQDVVAKTDPKSPEEERATFKLPPGFEIQLVAAEPDIRKPMNIKFDAKGRLWVTSSSQYPFPAKDGEVGKDTIKVLEDFGDDGKAKKVSTFAEGMNIPIGLLPIEGGVIAHSIPNVWKILDTDNDGKGDQRDLFFGTIGTRDTHGMTSHFTVGFDGWVYANHGFSNDSVVTAKDGSSIKMNSGNCYRFKLDGSHVEYFAHGQVNPFGLAFSPMGDLFSADCHTRPQMMLLRGGYYQSFGKPDDGLGFAPEMCMHDHGSTAISGTVYYDADQFPKEYSGRLFDGNPVTNKVNQDTIDWHGSSPIAVEAPDLVSNTDPWFRPSDLVLGPDGALYMADFYNRIIGHYEVPLTHPGRDHDHGRIWRIVYRGSDGKGAIPKMPDLSKMSADELSAQLGSTNIEVRRMASRQLVERIGKPAIASVKSALDKATAPNQKVHALWTLQLLGGLMPDQLTASFKDESPVVRTHVMRILSESKTLEPGQPELLIAGAKDADPFVRRSAADAMGMHPALTNIRPLLALRGSAGKDDTHLIHVVRMSLRNQLEDSNVITHVKDLNPSDDDYRQLSDVINGVQNPDAGGLIVSLIKRGLTDPSKTSGLLMSAAKRLPADEVDSLASLVLEKFPGNVDLQRELFVSLLEGLSQRGAAPGEITTKWGTDLAKKLLALDASDPAADWTFSPLPGSTNNTNPFTAAQSPFNKSDTPVLWSSHPKGEQLTGVFRSKPFEVPANLSFLVSGHYGEPGTNRPSKNWVRLKLSDGDEVVAETPPPRNDTPQRVTWDLKKWAGKKGYIEAVDGDTGTAYAWIAFGQFDPPVAPTPIGAGDATKNRLIAGTQIVRALKLADQSDRMEQILSDSKADAQARAGAARALGVMSAAGSIKALAHVASDPNIPPALRDAVSQALGEQNSPAGRDALLGAMAIASEPLQRTLALSLASNHDGAEALLAAVKDGKASPRLLQDAALRERLSASQAADLDKRVAELTKNLPAADVAIQNLIKDRIKAFEPAKVSADRGKLVFQKNCTACHQLDGVGNVVGPQLAGVGKRGLDRIAEDILDPSRNVDQAFRQTIIRLKGGNTVAGLVRREEGDLLVLADSTGKEQSVNKEQIDRRVQSNLSLMPSNFSELIKPDEFEDLAAYLLSK